MLDIAVDRFTLKRDGPTNFYQSCEVDDVAVFDFDSTYRGGEISAVERPAVCIEDLLLDGDIDRLKLRINLERQYRTRIDRSWSEFKGDRAARRHQGRWLDGDIVEVFLVHARDRREVARHALHRNFDRFNVAEQIVASVEEEPSGRLWVERIVSVERNRAAIDRGHDNSIDSELKVLGSESPAMTVPYLGVCGDLASPPWRWRLHGC